MSTEQVKKQQEYAGAIYLEQEGERVIDRVVEQVRTVPWSVTLLQLAWTAGPVTFIAMQGGFWLGFGTAAPGKNVLFFVFYTLIAGIVGVTTSILYKAARSRREKRVQDDLRRVIDQLPDLVFTIRDRHLDAIDPESRKREAAGLLLRKVDLGPESIGRAVESLTGNARLAGVAVDIELYRRAGLNSRVQDLIVEHRAEIDTAVGEVSNTAPHEANILRERLNGHAPNPEDGVAREQNFIERVLAAMDEDRLSLMSLRDAEEMLLLAFEFITGRELPVLSFVYRGRWHVAHLVDEVEAARNRYRLAQARIYNRLRALHDRLSPGYAATVDNVAVHTSAPLRMSESTELMDKLIDTLSGSDRPDTASKTDLKVAVELAESLYSAYREARQRYSSYIRALQYWQKEVNRYQRLSGHGFPMARRLGVRLNQRKICLDDDAKLEVAQRLAQYFDRIRIATVGSTVLKGRAGAQVPLGFEEIKRLGIQVALTLEPYIGLSRPDVQRAINSTNSIYLSGIEPGTSATTKAAWGAAMAAELRTDLAQAAERLALTLVHTYKVMLDDTAIKLLHEKYGANLQRLQTMAASQEGSSDGTAVPIPDFQPVLSFDERWRWSLERARRWLNKMG